MKADGTKKLQGKKTKTNEKGCTGKRNMHKERVKERKKKERKQAVFTE